MAVTGVTVLLHGRRSWMRQTRMALPRCGGGRGIDSYVLQINGCVRKPGWCQQLPNAWERLFGLSVCSCSG